MNTINTFYLLLSLGFWHFIADYVLTTKTMLSAKSKGYPFGPIFEHALWHAVAMAWIMVAFHVPTEIICGLFLFQLGSHFLIDVLKGRCNTWFPVVASPANKAHWVVFGLDQFLHFAVIVVMVAFCAKLF